MAECDVRINRGILTGCNDAFIIDGATKDRLIAEDPKSAEIIRPILRGRDIKRYGLVHNDTWLISTHNGFRNGEKHEKPIAISDYPAVKKHLDAYWPQIEKRADQGATPYNLRNCAYWDDFSKPKIIYPETMRVHRTNRKERFPRFALCENGEYLDKTCFMLLGSHPLFLLGVMNSFVGRYFIQRNTAVMDSGGHLLQKIYVEQFPIPYASEDQVARIEENVAYILDSPHDCNEQEDAIDEIVANLFGLDESEVGYILKCQEEQYERN